MSWPHQAYNTLSGPTQPLLDFDDTFNAMTAGMAIPCNASGTNTISLLPLANMGALQAYVELAGAKFRAVANSTGPVTAQINGLGFLPVYKSDGVTQVTTADIINGQLYAIWYSAALNSGLGGFFLQSMATASTITGSVYSPGGRLTFNTGVPVNFANFFSATQFAYSPYVHPFVPLFNGSTIAMYQFTSSLADINGPTFAFNNAANYPVNALFDIFITLIGGVPKLVTGPAWTNVTTRSLTLAVFGGFLTNGGSATFQQSNPIGSIVIPPNQATFLGTFKINDGIAAQSLFAFGGPASGGAPAELYLCNYYNKVQYTTIVNDTGASYTYTGNTARIARASGNNAGYFVQSDSERSICAQLNTQNALVTASGFMVAGVGIGSGATTASSFSAFNTQSATATNFGQMCSVSYSATGYSNCASLEQSDGTHANTFDLSGNNQLVMQIWL